VTGDPPHWWGAAIGLFLVGIGTGGIKPCVSSMGADQFQADQVEVIASFFSIFYFTINAGSTLSSFLTPMLRTYAGYAVAFAVPAGLICFATVLFAVGYRGYTHVKPTGIRNNVFLQLFRVMMAAIRNRFNGRYNRPVQHWIDRAQADYSQEIVYDVKCVLRVCKVLIPIMIFWSLFDQHSTRWVFQAARMDRQVGSYNFNADQITTLNPLLVLFLVMLFDRVIYKVVGLFMNPTPMRKISVGLLFTCASFIASAIVEICIVYNPGQVHVAWQIPQYVLLVIGEILVSVTGLEFAYSQAPKYYKGVMQSFYLLTVSMGNIVVFVVALIPIIPSSVALKGAYEFGFFAVLMFLTFIVFLFFARSYKYRKIQGEETTPISNEAEADTMLEA
jgi:dipeptide/tripeptide permease